MAQCRDRLHGTRHAYIVKTSGTRRGRAHVEGTRIPVWMLIE
jgi:uncharacterized protein (DUF433 family)